MLVSSTRCARLLTVYETEVGGLEERPLGNAHGVVFQSTSNRGVRINVDAPDLRSAGQAFVRLHLQTGASG